MRTNVLALPLVLMLLVHSDLRPASALTASSAAASSAAALGTATLASGAVGQALAVGEALADGQDTGNGAPPNDASKWTSENMESLVAIYRHLHQHPELSFEEEQTAKYIGMQLEKIGAEVTLNFGGFGVVGVLKNGEGPTVMLRTDLDGLPVAEQTKLAYSSKVKVEQPDGSQVSVMHACGHDVHMTNLVGTAMYLAANPGQWKGTIVLIGQPAEERGAGASAMLKEGLFEKFPRPDFALALHVDSHLAAGHVSVRPGFTLANVDSVDVTMFGKGGHGAEPHTAIDPIVQAAELVMSLQTLVSREVKPTEPAVVTVGAIRGGTKHNIIGDSCHLQITVRSYSADVRKLLLEGIKRKAKAVADGARGGEPKVEISEGTPALYNDDQLAARMRVVFEKTLGKQYVEESEQVMGGEDFSQYGRAGVPILMYRLGTVEENRLERFTQFGQSAPGLHSALYYPDFELSISAGIQTMSAGVIELLPKE